MVQQQKCWGTEIKPTTGKNLGKHQKNDTERGRRSLDYPHREGWSLLSPSRISPEFVRLWPNWSKHGRDKAWAGTGISQFWDFHPRIAVRLRAVAPCQVNELKPHF